MPQPNFKHTVNGEAIEVLAIGTAAIPITVATATSSQALPSGAIDGDTLRVASTTDCYIRFGTSLVEAAATDAYFPAGVEYLKVPQGATHLAAIRLAADGVLSMHLMV